jgi:archaemetzincin
LACGPGERTARVDPFVMTPLFSKKTDPGPSDWLARFSEPGESFEDYCAADPARARKGDLLRFVPVGPFSRHDTRLLEATTEFAALWFALPVEIADAAKLPENGWQRMNGNRRQYRTRWFLDHLLPPLRGDDAVCVSGITMQDLYPEESWNFVFGQASLRGRVGVWSFARLATGGRTEALRRCCKVVTHEIGHMFGLVHCVVYECNMNGSNHLQETDRQPLYLCPDCLKKLAWNRGFDVTKRYRALQRFYAANGFSTEVEWTRRRLKELSAASRT